VFHGANGGTLTLFRILLGIGMGMEFPIAQSMLSELIPASGADATSP
jgi:MFS family permease